MKPKAIVYQKVDQKVLEYIQQNCEVIYFEKLDSHNYSQFLHELKEAHGIFGAGLKIDKNILDQAPRLKIVCNVSVGYDNLDLNELSKRGIMATNTPKVLNETVADAVMGLIIATARRIPELDHWVKTGNWDAALAEQWYGVDVHHKKLGIIDSGQLIWKDYPNPDEAFNQSLAFQPLGRIGTIEDVANACVFLASEQSAYITGHTLRVDGGVFSKMARPLLFD